MSKRTKQPAPQDRRDPIDILLQEHAVTLKYLQNLHAAVEFIRANGFRYDAFQQIEDAIHFIDVEIRHHNEKEERYLFPLLERHTNTRLDAMRDEHRELWKALDRLQDCIIDVEESRIYSNTVRELISCCTSIVTLLKDHIEKENSTVFPLAKRLLTQEEYRQLQREMNGATQLTA